MRLIDALRKWASSAKELAPETVVETAPVLSKPPRTGAWQSAAVHIQTISYPPEQAVPKGDTVLGVGSQASRINIKGKRLN